MREHIKHMLKELGSATHPIFLSVKGFVSEADDNFIEANTDLIEAAYDSIPNYFAKTKRFNNKQGSHELLQYIQTCNLNNGAFIVAMMLQGYEWKRANNEINPNCYFKLKKRPCDIRVCRTCLTKKDINDFPKMGSKTSKQCLDCAKLYTRTHKNGYDLVSKEIKTEMKRYMDDGFSLRRIANKFSIPYANLFYWHKRGFI